MKAAEFIIELKDQPLKPRNFVAKNAMKTTSGAGAHRDKKKEQKQGNFKHKNQGVGEADLSVTGPKIITPIEGDKVEIKFGFNDYYDTHVTRGEIIRIRPDNVAQVMIDRTAKTEYFPLKSLKVIGPRGHEPGPKDTTFGTPANPELSVRAPKPNEGVDETRESLVWLQGKLRRSYSDQQLKNMGAYLQNNKWVMPRSKYQELTKSGVLEGGKEYNAMDTPEFQRALAGVKKKAAQGPMKTVYDPQTRKYKVVPVNSTTNK